MRRLAAVLMVAGLAHAQEPGGGMRSFSPDCDDKACHVTHEQMAGIEKFQQSALAAIRQLAAENDRLRRQCGERSS